LRDMELNGQATKLSQFPALTAIGSLPYFLEWLLAC
jgi:hypothetical protein